MMPFFGKGSGCWYASCLAHSLLMTMHEAYVLLRSVVVIAISTCSATHTAGIVSSYPKIFGYFCSSSGTVSIFLIGHHASSLFYFILNRLVRLLITLRSFYFNFLNDSFQYIFRLHAVNWNLDSNVLS